MCRFFFLNGGAIKINKFEKLFTFQKGLEHWNSRNKEFLYDIEKIHSYKSNAFCNVYDLFIPCTFLIKRKILEKLLK